MKEFTKELFCNTLKLIREQSVIDDEFDTAISKVCDGGYPGYNIENKYRQAIFNILEYIFDDDPEDCIIWDWVSGEWDGKIYDADTEAPVFEITSDEDLYDWLTGSIE